MGDQRQGGIEWTDITWNPIVGCSRISAGCAHCYAERQVARLAGPGGINHDLVKKTDDGPRFTGEVRFFDDRLMQPLSWRRPQRVFVNALSDLFHENLGLATIAKIFAVMALARRHTFQILTKRSARMRAILCMEDFEREVGLAYNVIAATKDIGEEPLEFPLRNVWLGVSVEDQRAADDRIPDLLETLASWRWLSVEPLLGPVNISRWMDPLRDLDRVYREQIGRGMFNSDQVDSLKKPAIDWVVVGGESGPGARPMDQAWARSIRDQCVAADVPFLFKQWGEYVPIRQAPAATAERIDQAAFLAGSFRVGKKAAGRLLDGRTWDEYPNEEARPTTTEAIK